MNISLKGEYALAALFDLAAHLGAGPVKIADISKRQKIPQKFLELILAGLKQGGFVESKRGAEGGYLLARPASSIATGDVLRYIGGDRPGRKRKETPFTDLWERVDKAVSQVIDQTTVEDLVRAWQDRQNRYVPNWDI
ncbi:MAG: Rrf2 family transcriptional regulator [Acidobacteria bacterium]|nr:Rrf2 family transcriptional regulator [Acidobacteriota bacterium]